jgi:hypothetical protein
LNRGRGSGNPADDALKQFAGSVVTIRGARRHMLAICPGTRFVRTTFQLIVAEVDVAA